MQTLSAHFRTFALDLWGFGDTSKASEKYSIAEYSRLLEAFVERLGIVGPSIVVGHGLGACVALRFAARNPSRVSRLATVALPLHDRAVDLRVLNGDQESIVSRLMENPNNFPEVAMEARKTDPAVLPALKRDMDSIETATYLEQISCPLLMIFGDEDPLIQHPNGRTTIGQATSTEHALVTLSSCLHFPMLEHSAVFDRLILDFVHASDDLSRLTPKEYWKRRTH
jgi:pimeloyl-ACP methyl ester carboxylesterase